MPTLTFIYQSEIDAFPANYPDCTVFEGDIIIQEQDFGGIINLDSLNQLTEVHGYFQITSNSSLSDLSGLDNLSYVESLDVIQNPGLVSLNGLNNLSSLNHLGMYYNHVLSDLNALENVDTIDLKLTLHGNDKLKTLEGLENLTYVEELVIVWNDSLTSLFSLENLNPGDLKSLELNGNPQLNICHSQPICDYLENSGPATIGNNAPGCNSQQEVEDACLSVSVNEPLTAKSIQVYPNPTTDMVQINIPDPETWRVRIRDITGRVAVPMQPLEHQQLDLSILENGLYFLEFWNTQSWLTKTVVKE
ncbi:MAG: T9SS type A sorting domain-containing protein [Bacteroidetes bacterium]|nr:T9SS type A sorting domain-containing protein [Bacteroidota bacterium]